MNAAAAKRALLNAEGLAGDLPAIVLDARRAADLIAAGLHGRRRAGPGDAFWQHREWRPGEGPRQIDWKRSARGDRLHVREKERETPALLQVWADMRPSMDWRGGEDRPTKANRAAVLALAVALATRAGGERACVLGRARPVADPDALARDLTDAGLLPPAAARPGATLFVSDGLEPATVWAARAAAARGARAEAVVVLVHDPAERDFPYAGRVRFTPPDAGEAVVVGRAEAAREAYRALWAAHLAEVADACRAAGARVFTHATDQPAAAIALAVAAALDHRV
jgi:uncharacterized protein (DUF58 family)